MTEGQNLYCILGLLLDSLKSNLRDGLWLHGQVAGEFKNDTIRLSFPEKRVYYH